MTDSGNFENSQANSEVNSPAPEAGADAGAPTVLYRERQWVPIRFWLMAAFVVFITTVSIGLNRPATWTVATAIICSIIAIWVLLSWSTTVVQVEQDPDGTRWLNVKIAQLPNDVVSRSLAVPKSARRAAMGPQLDPAAFLVTHSWVDEMVMFVLDDPEDPTPYWLISSKNPEELIKAFVPEQAQSALTNL